MTQNGHCLQILRMDDTSKIEGAKLIASCQMNSSIFKNTFIPRKVITYKTFYFMHSKSV